MKPILPILLILSLLNAGCGNSRMESLEKRVAVLESNAVADRQYNETNYQAVVQTCSNLFNMTTEDVTNWEHLALRLDLMTNLFALEAEAINFQQGMNSNVETRLAALEKKTPTNRPAAPARASAPPARPAAPALRYGIPADIFEAIAEKAAKDFPNDYDEQVFIIDEQITAYKKLHQ
jgi:hypothetical protein